MNRKSLCGCALALILALSAVGCGSTAPFVWFDQVPGQDTSQGGDVLIRDGDTIFVRVFGQDNLSSQQKVRADGKISTPVVGEIMAKGKKPGQLAKEIEERLKTVLQAPSVSIAIEQPAVIQVSVVGEVKQAGNFQLEPTASVLHALASAGGLSEYADHDKIFLVRKGMPQRVRFRFNDLRGGDAKAVAFSLRAGDVIIVE
jgi:polysaccharide biosynthesis/export protein